MKRNRHGDKTRVNLISSPCKYYTSFGIFRSLYVDFIAYNYLIILLDNYYHRLINTQVVRLVE